VETIAWPRQNVKFLFMYYLANYYFYNMVQDSHVAIVLTEIVHIMSMLYYTYNLYFLLLFAK